MRRDGLIFACLALAMACNDTPAGGAGGAGGTGGQGGQLGVGETCMAFCAKAVVECDAFPIDDAECQQFCQEDLNSEYQHAEACGTAAERVFECVSDLADCEEVEAWRDQIPSDGSGGQGGAGGQGGFPCQSAVSVYDSLIAARICLPPE